MLGSTPSLEVMSAMSEIESRTAIQNLVRFNVIVGMAERMDQSMTILRHVLVPPPHLRQHGSATATGSSPEQQEDIDALFKDFGGQSSSLGGRSGAVGEEILLARGDTIRMNSSGQEGISTELVLEELKKDAAFLSIFMEYVQYEQRIHDYALEMHAMQFAEAMGLDGII